MTQEELEVYRGLSLAHVCALEKTRRDLAYQAHIERIMLRWMLLALIVSQRVV